MAKQWSCWLFVVVAGLCGCGPATPELQLIHDAADAIGGVEAVRGAANVTMEGNGTTYQLGQNNRPASEPPSACSAPLGGARGARGGASAGAGTRAVVVAVVAPPAAAAPPTVRRKERREHRAKRT